MELEWGSIFGSHYKTSAGLDTFVFLVVFLVFSFRDEEAALSRLSFSACTDECRAANPGHEEDDGKGPAQYI